MGANLLLCGELFDMFEVCVKIVGEVAATLCRLSEVLKTGRLCVASIFMTGGLWQTYFPSCFGLC